MNLRPYQLECLDAIKLAYKGGRRRVLISLPTGTGKTVVFAQFPRYFGMKRRLLVLAHREELLEQAADKIRRANPDLTVDIEQASRRASPDSHVVIASVPTLGKQASPRLAGFDREQFYLVVADEAHHAVAPSYRRIFDHFGLFDPDTPRLLVGFTATPFRGDKQPLGEVFEEIVFSRQMDEMIRVGFLAPILGWRVSTATDLDGVRVRAGDFVERQLSDAVNTQVRNDLLVRAYSELTPGRRCLVFCVDVAHAQSVAAGFAHAGLRAAAVWGAMPRPERKSVLQAFSAGDLQIVTNCNVLTEGFDEPRVDAIVMARPTRSRLLYAQMVGRGTRLHPAKQDLAVIDIVDNTTAHTLIGLNDLFELPAGIDLVGRRAIEVADRVGELAQRFPWVALDRIESADELDLAAERVELFRFEPPTEISTFTRFAWCADVQGGYRLLLPDGERLAIASTLLTPWEISLHAIGKQPVMLGRRAELSDAVKLADAFVRKHRHDAVRVVDCGARWRRQAPSERQLDILRRRRIPIPGKLSRGEASWMISMSGVGPR